MGIASTIFLLFVLLMAIVLFGEMAFSWVMDRIVRRGVESVIVPKEDAEALLGKSHKGWRLWSLRFGTLGVIMVLLWLTVQRFQGPKQPTPGAMVDQVIDAGARVAESQIPGNDGRAELIKAGLKKGAESAKKRRKPD